MKTHQIRRAGFTLLELLVVIAVIAILAGLLLPALNKARMAGQKAGCGSGLKQIGNAMIMYRNDYDDYIAPRFAGIKHMYYWDFVYGHLYLNGAYSDGWVKNSNSWKIFRCPEDKTEKTYRRTYAMVQNLFNPISTGALLKGAAYKQSSSTYAIADTDYHGYLSTEGKYKESQIGVANDNGRWYLTTSFTIGPNHNNAANILFLDGHVASRTHWKGRDVKLYYDYVADGAELRSRYFVE